MDLGAKKADLAHDLARKYITIDDPQKQQALLANLRPVKKRDTTEKTADEVEADKAFVAVTGRYYTRRVNGEDPEAGLEPSKKGPANYRNATGALLLDAPSGKAAGGCLIMKGINSTKDDRPLVPKLVPKSKSGKTCTDGFINFKLKARGVSGTLRLKVASSQGPPEQLHPRRESEDQGGRDGPGRNIPGVPRVGRHGRPARGAPQSSAWHIRHAAATACPPWRCNTRLAHHSAQRLRVRGAGDLGRMADPCVDLEG